MVKPKKVATIPDAPIEEATVTLPESDSVTVTWRGNERVFSKAIHGENFRALAQEFCDTNQAVIV